MPRHAEPTRLDRLDDAALALLGPQALRGLLAALVAVLVTGLAAVSVHPAAAPGVSVRLSADVQPAVQAVAGPADPLPAKSAAPPAVVPPVVVKKPAKPAPAKRPAVRKRAPLWLPSGTGMWLHDFESTEGGSAAAVVARAKRVGLSTLYVQTGSSKKRFIGGSALSALLPATRGTGISVVAWDFPRLYYPEVDAARLAYAARYRCAGCPRVKAVAPDIETASEGTQISRVRAYRYLKELRRLLPADVPILVTVPWPSELRVGKYPYQTVAALSDAVLPMAYWYNRDPAGVTAVSMSYLKRFGKPVMPVGQGYDSRIDAPYLAPDPDPGASVSAFLTMAKHLGARHVSLWSWQTTGSRQWSALTRARKSFPVHRR